MDIMHVSTHGDILKKIILRGYISHKAASETVKS